jgi:Ca2+ transporting ATPase
MKALDTNLKDGISALSLDIRTEVFGTHEKPRPTATGFCAMVLAALDDLMLKVLIVCAFFSIVVDCGFNWNKPEKLKTAWIEGFAILMAVAIVSLFSAASDNKKEKQFIEQQNKDIDAKVVDMLRDGKLREGIHKDNIKVGDIIKINDGMDIPVDGILVRGSCSADESAMTGESIHVQKDYLEKCFERKEEHEKDSKGSEKTSHDVPSCLMLSGTNVAQGEGWIMCIVVGDNTCEGKIMAALDDAGTDDTPLQKKLDIIAMDIGRLGMYAAILIFHCLLVRNFIEGMTYRKYDLFGGELTAEGKPCSYDDIKPGTKPEAPWGRDESPCTG